MPSKQEDWNFPPANQTERNNLSGIGIYNQKESKESNMVQTPVISLPKGGGAIRGVGEKFAANPVTGTGSMSVPIAISPGRAGFGPQLSLSYDSGLGNGSFGFGWSLSLPSITRKTDKGLPKYQDEEESDVFILSGVEDLIPVLKKLGDTWKPENLPSRKVGKDIYSIKRYRPRIEGLFARIERWTNTLTNETHWRSISKDNITTVYGWTSDSRIEDPDAADNSPRIFSWLICESYDDKGNAIYYEYISEDSAEIDLSQTNERNRANKSRSANRYLKRIKYGNKAPVAPGSNLPREFREKLTDRKDWLFEVVFDYGEGHYKELLPDLQERQFVYADVNRTKDWLGRQDPFSSYRSGFEVRTYRLCHRVLMFHHFTNELGVDDYLVRSTEFKYQETPIASFITSVTQSGFKRQDDGTFLKKSLPPLEFEYSKAIIQDEIREVDRESLENLPQGLDGVQYQWVDIDGEGLSGILTEQGDSWFYKRNVSALPITGEDGKPQGISARFAPMERLPIIPSFTNLSNGRQQLLDLAGDGQLDVVDLNSPTPGFFERTKDEYWHNFRPFESLVNISWQDPNLRFIDLTGDGHVDILITGEEVFTWYQSLAEKGFASSEKVRQALDEEKGPKLLFADGTQSIYLADFSGDGLTDLARIRNSEVCYWPNLGYGRFGAKVTMDNSPHFDAPDLFDQRRIRLADIDGSGVTDIIYLRSDGVCIYLNKSGNSWSNARQLPSFPKIDNLSSVVAADLLGNGTACLVWSSPLLGQAVKPMRYIDLMGGQKPHLLIKTVNNLGAETHIHYAPSTKFYLADKEVGTPWITKIPFPIQVVERVEVYDRISRNRFVTRYAYHHGYFDGVEREFRGFGMVEQWDTEAYVTLSQSLDFPIGDNIKEQSHVPPVWTKTWFHTGAYLGRDRISNFYKTEYYGKDPQAWLLDDTILPSDLTVEEEREACRALKGAMLRQEVYALDGTEKEKHPYTVAEQNFTIEKLQPPRSNRYAVFFIHPCEALTYHYERNPADPRVQHTLTLEVDGYGNVLKEAAIGYGRRQPDKALPLQVDRNKQTLSLITYTENQVTNPIDNITLRPDNYRTPLPAETRTYELTNYTGSANAAGKFQHSDFIKPDPLDATRRLPIYDNEIAYETAATIGKQRRIIERVRTLYRKNDLTSFLPFSQLEFLALPGESYQLAYTAGLLNQVYQRNGQPLHPNLANLLGDKGADGGGYVDLEGNGQWWIPSGRVFFSPNTAHTAPQELTWAQQHFFLPHRYCDPFHSNVVNTETIVTYDSYALLIQATRDALANQVIVDRNDYRVLQPSLISDPNRNQTEVAFDALGMVVGTAVMGKPAPAPVEGDSLKTFAPDLPEPLITKYLADPMKSNPHSILGTATSCLVYDLFAFHRTKGQANPQPAAVYTLVRETHEAELKGGQTLIQHSFSYSDGFGREIQKKIQAEPEKIKGEAGPPRWVGSGWKIFNNKGKPIRQYEPFFSATHEFEFRKKVGVSPILFYDPVERVIATLHPNHTYEKVVFGPWKQVSFDVNDTVAAQGKETGDPRTDPDIQGYVKAYFAVQPPAWQTWYVQRQGGAMGPQEQDAAIKAAAHANTPTSVFFDTLGRPFLTLDHSKVVCANHSQDGAEEKFATRVEWDIEGNQRRIRDAIVQNGDAQGRVVMQYDYDMLGNRIHQLSMEAGERWMLNDVAESPIRAWDSRGHDFRIDYDPLRRELRTFVKGADPNKPNQEVLTERLVYGEQHPASEDLNLRGRNYLHFDQAGVLISQGYDFKGNPLGVSRRLTNGKQYRQIADWQTLDQNQNALPSDPKTLINPVNLEAALILSLEADTYTSSTTYDALNRPLTLTTPHTPAMQPSIIRNSYNEANLLERVDVNLRGNAAQSQLVWTPFVVNIDYDAKGQRQRIDYAMANGKLISTTYKYDPETFRLIHLYTRRGIDPITRKGTGFTGDCVNPQPPPPTVDAPEAPPGSNSCGLQNLHYFYDPAGNITRIRDDAQQTIYFKNKRVEPENNYTYDAVYRLIQATGREHLGQNGAPIPHSHDDAVRIRRPHPNDGKAMDRYCEKYVYDAVGNFLQLSHHRRCPGIPSWTRTYSYAEASLTEPAKTSNRLSNTTVGSNNPLIEQYIYDPHGNMIRLPHLGVGQPAPNMHWDCEDQLRQIDLGGGGKAYYVYDVGGERVRKVWEKSANLVEERIYLGGFEIYRRRNGAGVIALERETLHVMDDQQRIALVETRTLDTTGTDQAPQELIRYQFGNHLGSACLELDDQARIISYEEYTPYGSSSYQAVRVKTELPKRYRYSGKERDEESGLYYYGARYYAPWLARWCNCDPIGIADSVNLYMFVHSNPVHEVDPTGKEGQPPPWERKDLPPLGEPGHTPFNFIEDYDVSRNKGQFARHGREAQKEVLQRRYGKKLQQKLGRPPTMAELFSQFKEDVSSRPSVRGGRSGKTLAQKKSREYLAERVYQAFKRSLVKKEAKNPSFRYTAEQWASLKQGKWPGSQPFHHMHSVSRGGSPFGAEPHRAADPGNLVATKGQARVESSPHGKLHSVELPASRLHARSASRLLRAAVPFFGTYLAADSAAQAASRRDYATSAADIYGATPIFGDAFDLLRASYHGSMALGSAISEHGASELASQVGVAAQKRTRKWGWGSTWSKIAGFAGTVAGVLPALGRGIFDLIAGNPR